MLNWEKQGNNHFFYNNMKHNSIFVRINNKTNIMEQETWVKYTANGLYEVSSLGRIKSYVKYSEGVILFCNANNLGYHKITLKPEGGYKGEVKSLHRVVAEHFIPNPQHLPEVNHKDRNKSNNAVGNLEWCTHQQNIIHSYLTREVKKGSDSPLFGRKASKKTRRIMSEGKKGSKHPKFKGFYVNEGVKYSSSTEASKGTGINSKTIIRYAKDNKFGWSFEPVKVQQHATETGIVGEWNVCKSIG